MSKIIRPDLIRNYLAGKCTPEEKREVEDWYNTFEKDTSALEFLSEEETEKLRSVIFRQIREKIKIQERIPDRPRAMWLRPAAAGIAALLVIGAGLFWLLSTGKTADGKAGGRKTWAVADNTGKSIQRVSLPDGSTAWLQPNSFLRYPEHFRGGERAVTMTGEVFFEVAPDSLKPFLVYSGGMRTKVLGTSFRIRAYKTDPFAQVSVVTGRVLVGRIQDTLSAGGPHEESGPAAGVVLTANESIVFSEQDAQFTRVSAAKDPEMAIWKKNNLSFDNVPVKEVLKKLSSVYRVEFVALDEKIDGYILRADFTGMNLPDVLEVLEHSLGVTYEKDNNIINLKISGE